MPREPRVRRRDPPGRLVLDGPDARDRAHVPEREDRAARVLRLGGPEELGDGPGDDALAPDRRRRRARPPGARRERSSTLLEKGPDAPGLLHPARERVPRSDHPPLRLVDRQGRPPDGARSGALPQSPRARGPRPAGRDTDPAITPMLHYTCRSLGQYLEKLHRYADVGSRRPLPGRTPRGRGRAACSGRLAVLPDVRDPGRVSRRPPRPRAVRPPGVERLPQVGQGLGVGPLSTEWLAGRAAGIR